MKRSTKRLLGLAMSLILLLSLLSAGVLAAQTAVGEVYLISEDTVEFPGWPLAPDEISIQFVSASEGTATLSLTEVDPGYHVIVYQDNLWLDSYSGTTASDVVEFPVQEGSEYLVYLSAVLSTCLLFPARKRLAKNKIQREAKGGLLLKAKALQKLSQKVFP